MNSYILSIDQGTTGTRVLLVDGAGKIRGQGYQSFRQYYPKPGWVEHDPEEIWVSLEKAFQKLTQNFHFLPTDIKAIGITNQRETTILWNPRTGRAYHRAIVWQCRRTTSLVERLKAKGVEKKIQRLTGLPLDPYFSSTKLTWLFENIRGLHQKARKGEVLFGTIDSYLLWRLTGGETHATDWTNASRTQLFNITKKKWDPALLKIFKAPAAILPQALPSKSSFGRTRGLSFLPDGIEIRSMIGDQQSALFGQGCFKVGEAKNTYGTGSFFVIQLGKRPIFSKRGFLTTLALDAKGESSYALEGSIFIAGAAIQWIRDELRLIRHSKETASIARQFRRREPDPHVFFVPALEGLGAPYWNPRARGAFVGLTRGSSRAELVTAVLESLAYSVAELAQAFEEESRTPFRLLKADGGASQNDYLLELQSNLLGRPVLRSASVEATALGAARLAGLGLKFFKSRSGFTSSAGKLFKPVWVLARRRRNLTLWKEAIRRVL